jgi:hypothetical protein
MSQKFICYQTKNMLALAWNKTELASDYQARDYEAYSGNSNRGMWLNIIAQLTTTVGFTIPLPSLKSFLFTTAFNSWMSLLSCPMIIAVKKPRTTSGIWSSVRTSGLHAWHVQVMGRGIVGNSCSHGGKTSNFGTSLQEIRLHKRIVCVTWKFVLDW